MLLCSRTGRLAFFADGGIQPQLREPGHTRILLMENCCHHYAPPEVWQVGPTTTPSSVTGPIKPRLIDCCLRVRGTKVSTKS